MALGGFQRPPRATAGGLTGAGGRRRTADEMQPPQEPQGDHLAIEITLTKRARATCFPGCREC